MKTIFITILVCLCLSLQAVDTFVIHEDIYSQLSSNVLVYDDANYTTDPKAKLVSGAVAFPYVAPTGPRECVDNFWLLDQKAYDYKTRRNNLIENFAFMDAWNALSLDDKKALIEYWVWPSAETTANLDLLHTQAERDKFRETVIVQLNKCDCNLHISPNGKLWNVLPDDTGGMSGVEIKTDQIIQEP